MIYEQSAQHHSGYSNRFGYPASEYSNDYEDQYYYKQHKPGHNYQDYYKPSYHYPQPDSNFIEETLPQIFKSGSLGYRPRFGYPKEPADRYPPEYRHYENPHHTTTLSQNNTNTTGH